MRKKSLKFGTLKIGTLIFRGLLVATKLPPNTNTLKAPPNNILAHAIHPNIHSTQSTLKKTFPLHKL